MGIYNMSEVFLNKSKEQKTDISFNTTTSSALPEWLTIIDHNSDNRDLQGGNINEQISSYDNNMMNTNEFSPTSSINDSVFAKTNKSNMLTSDNTENITETLTSTTNLENRLKDLFSNSTVGGGKKKKSSNTDVEQSDKKPKKKSKKASKKTSKKKASKKTSKKQTGGAKKSSKNKGSKKKASKKKASKKISKKQAGDAKKSSKKKGSKKTSKKTSKKASKKASK